MWLDRRRCEFSRDRRDRLLTEIKQQITNIGFKVRRTQCQKPRAPRSPGPSTSASGQDTDELCRRHASRKGDSERSRVDAEESDVSDRSTGDRRSNEAAAHQLKNKVLTFLFHQRHEPPCSRTLPRAIPRRRPALSRTRRLLISSSRERTKEKRFGATVQIKPREANAMGFLLTIYDIR